MPKKRFSQSLAKILVQLRQFPNLILEFPVQKSREFVPKALQLLAKLEWLTSIYSGIAKIPVLFPVSREIRSGDGFDIDCVRHQRFQKVADSPSLDAAYGLRIQAPDHVWVPVCAGTN